MSKPKTFDFISDPGHGWLKVPIALLVQLNIVDKISGYSYQRDNYAYLEEDCDAPLLLNALKGAGIDYKLRDKCASKKQSRIRGYAHFTASR